MIKERADVDLRSLLAVNDSGNSAIQTSDEPADEALLFRYANIRRLTGQDYELIREALYREQTSALSHGVIPRLAQTVAAKLEVEPPLPAASTQFLSEVLKAYRQIW